MELKAFTPRWGTPSSSLASEVSLRSSASNSVTLIFKSFFIQVCQAVYVVIEFDLFRLRFGDHDCLKFVFWNRRWSWNCIYRRALSWVGFLLRSILKRFLENQVDCNWLPGSDPSWSKVLNDAVSKTPLRLHPGWARPHLNTFFTRGVYADPAQGRDGQAGWEVWWHADVSPTNAADVPVRSALPSFSRLLDSACI